MPNFVSRPGNPAYLRNSISAPPTRANHPRTVSIGGALAVAGTRAEDWVGDGEGELGEGGEQSGGLEQDKQSEAIILIEGRQS